MRAYKLRLGAAVHRVSTSLEVQKSGVKFDERGRCEKMGHVK